MSKAPPIDGASRNRLARPANTIAVVLCLIALSFTAVRLQSRPQRFRARFSETTLAEVKGLERRFHECYTQWEPHHGVRSPCPELQNDTNIRLLNLLGLQRAHPSKIVQIIGRPEAVFENGRYPGIFYWKLEHYWATMAPNCVMLLPRNRQYDAMIHMSLQQDGAHRVSLAQAILNGRSSTVRTRTD